MSQTKKEFTDNNIVAGSEAFVKYSDDAIENVEPGIRRQILGFDHNLMAVRVWFEKGAVGAQHTHPHTQVSYVESGVFEVTIGDDVQTLTAGDSFYVSSEVLHGAICREAGVLVDMFAPMREDFLTNGDQA